MEEPLHRIDWYDFNPVVSYANYLKCLPGYQFGPRFIHSHQFIYVVRGAGTAIIQDRHYTATEGDLFYYGPNIVHCFRANDEHPFELIGVHFELTGDLHTSFAGATEEPEAMLSVNPPANLLTVGERGPEELRVPESISMRDSAIQPLLLQMVSHFKSASGLAAVMNRSLLVELFYLLSKHIQKVEQHYSPQLKILYTVAKRLSQSAALRYDRSWISEWTGYHEDYLSKNFKTQFGISPHHYHMLQKIDHAKELLSHTEQPITQIAEELHFNSVHYFCRVFKKQTAFSPQQFRLVSRML
ncbi:AraC family transcriptional regulator [Paenibacillaceae bacterium]|nr:AraC family transcriptional regulator [Paenibacillaceae bacterium]